MNEIITQNYLATQKPLYEVIEDFVSLKRSIHTQRAYKSDLHLFFNALDIVLLEELGQIPFAHLIKLLQEHFSNTQQIESEEDRFRILNPRTVNRKTNALRSFFKYLISVYRYPQNPLDQFPNLKTKKFSSTQSLTRGEVIDLLQVFKEKHRLRQIDFRNYLIALFLFSLALRVNECTGLKWDDLDTTQQQVNVYQKGGGYKLLPLPHPICVLLQEYKERYINDDAIYVFSPTRNNSHRDILKPISTTAIFKMIVTTALRIVPEKNITPHSLRKTFIELSLDNNEDLISIANATGHASIEMIKYYDTRDKLKNNAVNGLVSLI